MSFALLTSDFASTPPPDVIMRRASGDNIFIGSSPRYLMEAIGMILIAILAYSLTLKEGGFLVAIPILGVLAVGAQKLLPLLQQVYLCYSTIKGSKSSFADVLDLLSQPLPNISNQNIKDLMPFKKEIVLKNLSFRYTKNTPWILRNVNLRFKKGDIIGFIGVTGAGKSTLLDILMGLLTPSSGELLVDGISITPKNRRSWQAHISHVPQSIYLTDSTIQENIAFGIKQDNKFISSFGDLNVLSLHATKVMHSIEGGIIFTKNKKLIKTMRLRSQFGHIGDHYLDIGINAKLSELHSIIGIEVFKEYPKIDFKEKKFLIILIQELKIKT